MSDIDNDQTVTDEPDVTDLASQLELEPEAADETTDDTESHVDEAESTEETSEDQDTEDTQEVEDKSETVVEEKRETEAERNQRFYEMRQAHKREIDQAQRQIEKSMSDNYQPQPLEELTQHFIDQGYDEFQATMLARDEVRNQKEQINEARLEVVELNGSITTETMQVLNDFPIFNPNSPDYDEAFTAKAVALYAQSSGIVRDPKTNAVVQANLMPYNFYKELADMRESSGVQAQTKAQKALEQQMASVAPPSSAPSKTPSSADDKMASDLERAFTTI